MKKIFLILLSFVVTLNAQWSLVGNPSLLKVNNINLETKVASETLDTNYLSAYILYGYNPVWIDSVTFADGSNTTLLSNEVIQSNPFVNGVGDLLSGWDLTTWTNVSVTGTITTTSFTSTASCGLYFTTNFESGARYKIKYAYSTTATGGVRLMWRDGTGLGSAINSYTMSASGTLTATSDKAGFYINQNGSGTTTVIILSAEKISDDFIYNGNAILTENADSTATYDNNPLELAPNNGEFVFNYTYWVDEDFASSSGWAVNGTTTISSGVVTISGDGTINNWFISDATTDLTTSTAYIIEYEIISNTLVGSGTITTGDISGADAFPSSTSLSDGSYSVGVHKIVKLSESATPCNRFSVRLPSGYTSGSIVLDNIKIYKAIAPSGWTASTMSATNYVIEDTEGLRLVSDGGTMYVLLQNVFTVGHKYKREVITGNYTLGNIRIVGDGNNAYPSANSTYVDTITATLTYFGIYRNTSPTDCIIKEVHITEVFDETNVKLPLPTEEYAWYEGSLSYQEGEIDLAVNGNMESSLFTLNSVSPTYYQATGTQSTEQANNGLNSWKVSLTGLTGNARIIPNNSAWNNENFGIVMSLYLPSSQTLSKVIIKQRVNGIDNIIDTLTETDNWINFNYTITNGSTPTTDRYIYFDLAGNISDFFYVDDIKLYHLDSESQKVESATPIVTFNDNTSFTLNPISATWQDTVLGFWGAVEDDYLSFDGVNDYITITDDNSLDFGTNDFTIIVKGNYVSKLLGQRIMYKRSGGSLGFGFGLDGSGHLVLWFDDDIGTLVNGTAFGSTDLTTLNDPEIKIIFDRDQNATAYINNSIEGTINISGLTATISNANNLVIMSDLGHATANCQDGIIKEVIIINGADTVLNLNGTDGNITASTWYDESSYGNDGTISGATLMQPPFLEFTTDDTCKVKLKINSVEQVTDKIRVTKNNNGLIGLSTDISTVGSYVDNGTVHTTVGDYPFTVTSEVIPSSNVLHAPESLVASANISGIGFSWTDINVPDTNLYLNQTFDVELEQDLLWTQNNVYSITTSSADRLRIERASGTTNQYQSAWITFDDLQCYTQISLDAYIGTASKVCMVVYGYVDGLPTTISYQESTTDTTFTYNYDLTNYESIKVFAQIITTANGQYGTFDNFTIYNTSPSYDNWVLKLHDWYNGYMINEWYIGATGTDGTSYLLTGLSDGDKKSGMVGFVYSGDTLWSDVDTATFHQAEISYGDPVAADYWIRNDVSSSWGTNGANAKDSTVCVNYDTLLAHLGDIDILNPVIAFRHNQNHLGYLEINGDDYPNLEGFTITSWMTDAKASVGVYGELEGWDNPDVWTNPVYDSDGATWKFVFADFPQYTFNDSLLIGRMIFDDTLETLAYVYSGINGLSEAEVSFSTIAGKEYTYPNDKYRWSQYKYHPAWGGTAGANFQDYVYVWTPDSSKPSSYYSSIKIPQCIRSNAHARTTAMRFENLDNFTFKNIEISGGDQISVEVINCDNVTFDSVLVDKFSYDGLRFWSCYKPQVKNSVFLGYDSEALYSDSVHAEASAKQSINFLGDCDSVLVYKNYIESVSIQSISFYSNYVVEGSTGSGFGTSDDAIIWGNHIKNTTDRFYQRAFQFTCEVSGIDPDDLNNVAHNATIVGNLFEGLTVGNKCRVDTMLYAYNIWTGATKHWTYNIDHSIIREFDDGSFLDGAFQRSSHHYLINNTFVNGIEDLTSETANRNYITFGNNLFLGMNQVNQRGGADLYWNDNGRAIVFRNNYSYNVNDENKAIYIKPNGESGGDYDLSWYQLNSASLTNVTASGNLTSQGYVNDIDSCLTDWQNSDYSINLNNSYINQGGYDFSSLLPSWFTEDYYGNVIRKTSPNIGAVDNR